MTAEHTRGAAVAIVCAGDPVHLLLIRRAEHPSDPWSGQMALPGGRIDPLDLDTETTARRETHEETGVLLTPTSHRTALSPVPARSRLGRAGFDVQPHVFWLPERPLVTPNHEVAETLWAPLPELFSESYRGEHRYIGPPGSGMDVRFPAFQVNGRVVWGLTYQILRVFGEFLGPEALAQSRVLPRLQRPETRSSIEDGTR